MDEGTNKSARGDKSPFDTIDRYESISIGEVVSVEDPNYLGRIQVRIKGSRAKGGDDGISDNNLPWCFPLIPKFISTQPQPKEAVFIFVFKKDRQHTDRMYMGPIISQPQQLNFDPLYVSALAGFSFGSLAPDVSVARIPELLGVFPNPEDVSIQGRYNTEVTQKTNEVIIKAGKFTEIKPTTNNPFPFTFNKTTQGYIQIKNDVIIGINPDSKDQQKGTITNIVANKINLLTHENGSPRFNLTDQNTLITDDEQANILNTAHPLAYGDIMVQWMKLCQDAIFNHVHNGNGNAATDLTTSGNKQSINTFKKNTDKLIANMLSNNIRIN